jgi:Tol biopolymer transport system component
MARQRSRRRHAGLVVGLLLAAGLPLVQALPASATPPGRNGRIAFGDVTTGELYSINPDGTSLRQLTHVAPAFAADPDWSPNGQQIAFWGNQSGDPRLYVMDRDGSHQRLVFNDRPGVLDVNPAFTPDGQRLVFQRCAPAPIDTCAIFSVGISGTGLKALTSFKTGAHEANDLTPSVSRDGRIAFGRRGANGITAQAFVMAPDGSGAHPITPPALGALPYEWAPDGRHVLVQSDVRRNGDSIYRVRADGTGLTRLSRPTFPHNDAQPNPSPDGRQIALISDRRFPDFCCLDLLVMNADGSGLHRVPTGTLTGVAGPDWGTAP